MLRAHPRRGRRADVRGELLHRAVRRCARQHALPVFRRPARSLRRRSRRARSRSPTMPNSLTLALLRHGEPLLRAVGRRRASSSASSADDAPRPRQRGLAGRADAPRRTGCAARSWCRATTAPSATATRTARCWRSSPSTSSPRWTATRRASELERRVEERTQALQQSQPRPAGRDRRAPARRTPAARAVPHRRAVDDLRDAGAASTPQVHDDRRRAAVCAQFLHRAAVGATAQ